MASLADARDLVGFFSYSREDDEGSGGRLSKLRERIQEELRGQLGRTKRDFRLWQDKVAIAHGELWEDTIKKGISESLFFIPIITPTAVRSYHCKFEFDSFLAREKELGRSNLVFPILYIPVPALADDGWRQDPLLEIIGSRQYEQWQNLRHLDPSSTEVALRVEKFCENICKALQQPWLSPQERQEAEARQRAEEDRRREEKLQEEARRVAEEERQREEKRREEARRVAEEKRRGEEKIQEEARQRAEAERRREEAETERRLDEAEAEKRRRDDRRRRQAEALGDKAGLGRWRVRALAGAAALAVLLLIGVGGYVFVGHIVEQGVQHEAQHQRLRVPVNATQIFDASVVPLVTDLVRASLAEYPKQSDVKALAISADSYGMSVGASSLEVAQREALDQCRPRSTTIGRIYATGTTVSWSKEWIPLPASSDLRIEPLDLPLVVAAELQNLLGAAPDNRYLGGANHRAWAYTTGGGWWFTAGRSSRSEAVRQAVERCGYRYQRQCMIVSVDGFPTVQIPKSRHITGLFMPATEPDMSDAARQRVAEIYQAREWRAVARGKSGTWYAIAAETSELAAVVAALKSCAQGDDVCSLYAIGNFRVSDAN